MKQFIALVLLLWTAVTAHGQGQPRIMNGIPANVGQFPYQAYISDDYIACGASIVHKRWLLTAAHCQPYAPRGYAIVGTVDKTGLNGTRIRFEKFIKHRGYAVSKFNFPFQFNDIDIQSLSIKKDGTFNDIALIRLREDLKFNDQNVQPIKLATDKSYDYANVTATLSGWGVRDPWENPPTNLQYGRLKVVGEKECSVLWRMDVKNKICTAAFLFQEEKASVCIGDSGGPLVHESKQIGIVSYGHGNCGIFLPDVYVRVASYLPWIQRQLNSYSDKLSF